MVVSMISQETTIFFFLFLIFKLEDNYLQCHVGFIYNKVSQSLSFFFLLLNFSLDFFSTDLKSQTILRSWFIQKWEVGQSSLTLVKSTCWGWENYS